MSYKHYIFAITKIILNFLSSLYNPYIYLADPLPLPKLSIDFYSDKCYQFFQVYGSFFYSFKIFCFHIYTWKLKQLLQTDIAYRKVLRLIQYQSLPEQSWNMYFSPVLYLIISSVFPLIYREDR